MLLFIMLMALFIVIVVVSTVNFVHFNRCIEVYKKSITSHATISVISDYDLNLLNRILGDGKEGDDNE